MNGYEVIVVPGKAPLPPGGTVTGHRLAEGAVTRYRLPAERSPADDATVKDAVDERGDPGHCLGGFGYLADLGLPAVCHQRPRLPSYLADTLGLTRGALSARLGPIEQAGLITRTTDQADRRRVHVRLTAAGHAAFEQHGRTQERGESSLLAALTADEKQVLAGLLRKLVLALETAHMPDDG